MHVHFCRHCGRDFICGESLDCFQDLTTCRDCFWSYELPHFLLFLALGGIAIVAVVVAFNFFGGR